MTQSMPMTHPTLPRLVRTLRRGWRLAVIPALAAAIFGSATPVAADVQDVIRELDDSKSVDGSDDIKSYIGVFDAYLETDPPPLEIGDDFNNTTVHPGMPDWDQVRAWAESNQELAEALLEAEKKTLFGLPYSDKRVKRSFREAGLVCRIGVDGSLRDNQFPYLNALDVISTYAVAESYRRLEAGDIDGGLDLAVATTFFLRQCCDREFLDELFYSISLTTEMLTNMRDMFWLYRDEVSAEKFGSIAQGKLPFLRPDRGRLLMPEGDRVVAAALIDEVFDDNGQAIREKFASSFAQIQSEDAPLTRFGAARRWGMIAEIHDSEAASQKRLRLIYDDWWRRWRVQEYDPILAYSTQFERTNPIRYAAVIYSMQDIEGLFAVRNQLVVNVHGTAVAAGLLGYQNYFSVFPSTPEKGYSQFLRKSSDRDPYDLNWDPFMYRILDSRFAVDTPEGRIQIDSGTPILYALGVDHEDGRGARHTHDAAEGDFVLFPPLQTLAREQGLID